MYKAKFDRLTKEYAKKDQLYPDRGRSFRPWEEPLRRRIQDCLEKARQAGEAWAQSEPNWV